MRNNGERGPTVALVLFGIDFARLDFSVRLSLKVHEKKSDENLSCLR